MPIITSATLQHLPVVTQSGQQLGHIRSWEMDTESHIVVRYHVKQSGIARILGDDALIVTPSQVVAITAEQMVVRDEVVAATEAQGGSRRTSMRKRVVPALTRAKE